MFFKIAVLKNFHSIVRKTPVLESLFNKVAGLKACIFIKKETPTQVFYYKYCGILKNSFFCRTPHCSLYFSVVLSDDRILCTFLSTKLTFLIFLVPLLWFPTWSMVIPYLFSNQNFQLSVTFTRITTSAPALFWFILKFWALFRNNSRIVATFPSNLLWIWWIWVFFNIVICYYFSLEAVLQGMAKNDSTKQQIDAEIQATFKHPPAWKHAGEKM